MKPIKEKAETNLVGKYNNILLYRTQDNCVTYTTGGDWSFLMPIVVLLAAFGVSLLVQRLSGHHAAALTLACIALVISIYGVAR